MRRKKAIIFLSSIVTLGLIVLAFTFKVGNAPLLGLDLEGGVAVVLKPQGGTDEQISQAITIMNQRINTLGVAEPDIHREGSTIVVQIAGLKDEDKDKAIKLVGETAQLRFRPLLAEVGPEAPSSTPGTTAPGTGTTVAPSTTAAGAATTVAPSTTAQVTPGGSPTSSTPPTGSPANGGQSMGRPGIVEGESAAGGAWAQAPTTTAAPPTTAAPAATAPAAGATASLPTTSPQQDNTDAAAKTTVVLKGDPRTERGDSRYQLGPACSDPNNPSSCLTGDALSSTLASINQQGQWEVRPTFKGGAEGIDKFNALAAKCFNKAPECPTQRMAITLDGLVLTAPTIQAASYSADQIQITGSFTEDTARNLATALQYGALPVRLEQQSSQAVSATIGKDALTAGLAAGFVGLLLVAIYMVAFYRLLGILAILKLAVEGMFLWSIISYLGQSAGLALTLAGVTGIIVSIGVSLDSNVVYYEHLREDVRNGRTLRSAVDRSFGTAMSTILKADGASLLGAVLLYWLAVGPVKGFAFYLGLSTLLDLISSYFYMHPVVFLAANSKLCQRRPTFFGLPEGPPEGETSTGPVRPSRSRSRGSGATARTPVGARRSSERPSSGEPAAPTEGSSTDRDEGDGPNESDPATTKAN